MIRRLISSCLSFVLGGLLLPLVSFAAISGTTCDARSMTTTTSAAIAERATSTSVNQDGETELQSITSGPVRTLYDIRRGLVAAKSTVQEGTTVYRVWGGKSGPWGESWTTVNPNTVPNLRSAAGLPDVNTGRFVSEGVLQSTEGVTSRGALIIKPGQQGNLPELVIKNAEQQIKLRNVSGVNPEF